MALHNLAVSFGATGLNGEDVDYFQLNWVDGELFRLMLLRPRK